MLSQHTAKQLPCSAAYLVVIVVDCRFKPCARLNPAGLQTEEGRIRAHCAFVVLSSVNGRGKVLVQLRRTWNFVLDNQGLKHMSLMDTIEKGKLSYLFCGEISACQRKQPLRGCGIHTSQGVSTWNKERCSQYAEKVTFLHYLPSLSQPVRISDGLCPLNPVCC